MRLKFAAAFSLAMLLPAAPVAAQQIDISSLEITVEEIKPGVAVLLGGEIGNIGVGYGDDATLLVDDHLAPMTPEVQAAVAGLGASPTKFLVNTHWHWDHAGGNENFANAGATIFAHDNARVRLVSGGKVAGQVIAPAPGAALPVVTFNDGLTLHLNGDTVDVRFLGGGHTDGDSVVFWREANVLHAGDLFVSNLGYPFIDLDSGGDVEKLIESLDGIIAMTDKETVIIPGHGDLASQADLVAFRTMVATAVDRVRALKDAGMTLEAAKAKKPIAGLRNNPEGFIPDDMFVETIWKSLDGHSHGEAHSHEH